MTAFEVRLVGNEPDAVAAWYAPFREGITFGRTHPMVLTLTAIQASVATPSAHGRRELWAAFEGDEIVGTALVWIALRDNLHVADVELVVPPGQRGRGVGAAVWDVLEKHFAAEKRTTLLSEIHVNPGVGLEEHAGACFAAARGFIGVHTEDRLVLTLPPTVSLEVPVADGYSINGWSSHCPEEYVEQFTAMNTAMTHDVPIGEMDWEPVVFSVDDIRQRERRSDEQGYARIISAALRGDGVFGGYTELLVPLGVPDIYQEDTLVLREHRGQRLGAALKAANLARLLTDFPSAERVQTYTASDNGAMQKINADFGFEPVEVMHEFQRKVSR